MCQANQQNWNKTESLSKAVHKAGQQQQEHSIRYVQETLERSVPSVPFVPWWGKGGQERMVPEEWKGPQVPGWFPLHELQGWRKQRSPKGHGTVSPVVHNGRDEPEDNSKDEGRAGERK